MSSVKMQREAGLLESRMKEVLLKEAHEQMHRKMPCIFPWQFP